MKKRTILLLSLAAIVLLGSAVGSTVALRADNVDGAIKEHRYSIAGYEISNLARLPGQMVSRSAGTVSDVAKDVATVRDYLSLADRKNSLESEYDRTAPGPQTAKLAAVTSAGRDLLEKAVPAEAAASSLVTEELRAQGFSLNRKSGSVFPPVLFSIEEMPHVLVLSPRDRIEVARTALLSQSLTPDEISGIETRSESSGFSSLVDRVGGVATYPSLVSDKTSLRGLFSTVAHEWTHQYMFFFPLGRSYGASYQITSINETVADMVGEEIAGAILKKQFAVDDGSPSRRPHAPPAAFDFNKEMRLTRVTVDKLLSEGKIEEAESYMKDRQTTFNDNGYSIRRLNQAYFAWYGSYGDSPAVVSPIFTQLKALRARAGSLSAFVKQVRDVKDEAGYRRLVSGE